MSINLNILSPSRRGARIIGILLAVALIGWCFAYDPVTRNFQSWGYSNHMIGLSYIYNF